jgi:hypothetical protein
MITYVKEAVSLDQCLPYGATRTGSEGKPAQARVINPHEPKTANCWAKRMVMRT